MAKSFMLASFVFATLFTSNVFAAEKSEDLPKPESRWVRNYVEMGLSTSDSLTPQGAMFSYSHCWVIAPKALHEHFGVELKLQIPPFLPNVAFRAEPNSQVSMDVYYGGKVGPYVQLNRYVTFSALAGLYGVGQGRVYVNDVSSNAAANGTWAVVVQPGIRFNLGAFTIGAFADIYKNDTEIGPLKSGALVPSPAIPSVSDITSGNYDASKLSGVPNTDNLGKSQIISGEWRTRLNFTIGLNF
jgi:hypothetical protein